MTDGYGEGEARKFMAPLNRIILSPSPDHPPIAFVFLSETKVEDTALPIRRVTAQAIYDSKVDDIAPPLRHIPAQPQIIAAADSSNKGGSPLNPNLILIGGAAGVLLLIIIGCIVAACISRNKRKNRKPQYYLDPSTRKGNDYYIDGTPQKWGNHDHAPQKWQPPQATLMSTDMVSGPIAPLMPPPSPNVALGFNKSTFTYEELVTATGSFCQANLLGQGGFGYVHKGVLPTGKEIAVKSLKSGSGQGEREFQAEVDIISRVHHRHLVSLVGYCIAGEKRLLVYDFVANKTLEHHLYGKGVTGLNWPTRLKIALGSAKGLAYLHEDCHPRIIHRDIKAANILLDMKFEALVADFGLAKLNLDNNTHVSTRVMGTFGYLAPEYASSGKLTDKSDVFSYGVMLLEIITGRRPYDSKHYMDDSLVDWARPVLSHALSDGNYDELVDPRLNGNYDPVEMARMVACAAASVRHSARKRPKMSQIVRALAGDLSLEDLNEGMRPGQSMLYGSGSDYEDMHGSKSRRSMKKVALGSPDFSDEFSDQFSDTMGDFNHHRAATLGSDGLFSEDLNPVGNQRYGALSPY